MRLFFVGRYYLNSTCIVLNNINRNEINNTTRMEARDKLKYALSSHNFDFTENLQIRMGRRDYKVDFLLKNERIGIITLDWNRTIPVSKILQLERIQNALKLKELILICNSISDNAREFLSYRKNIRIRVIHSSKIKHDEIQLEDLLFYA